MTYWQSQGIACLKPHPLLGHITGWTKVRSFPDILTDYYEKLKGSGPFAGFYWFQKPTAFVLEPELMKNILIKDFPKFTDRGFYSNPKDDPITGHLFLLEGQEWRQMRHKLSPTFTSGKMKNMFPMVVDVGHVFIDVFGQAVDEHGVVEVKDLLSRFTTDVIGTCAFGIDCNSLKDPNTEFRLMGQRALTETRHNLLGIAFTFVFRNLAKKLHMKLTPDDIEEFFFRIVRETIDVREREQIRRNDFMGTLIDLKNNKTIVSEDDGELQSISLEQIVGQAFVFFAAGFETSSTTMGFALYELAKHEDIQERARQEVQAILAQHGGELTYDCMKDMKYLDQVIAETLRLYTVVPVLNRACLEDFVVPNNPKYVIKKGMSVVIPIGAMHRDPKYYSNPEEFDPEHFSEEAINSRDPILYMPFGEGPRNCIGMRFGQMQMRICLTLLLSRFKFSLTDKSTKTLEMNKKTFIITTASGIYINCERI